MLGTQVSDFDETFMWRHLAIGNGESLEVFKKEKYRVVVRRSAKRLNEEGVSEGNNHMNE